MSDYFNYHRRKSSVVNIGNVPLGANNPIRIQSMANVSTMETESAVEQAIRMIQSGAEYVRFTTQGEREARNLGKIRKKLHEAGYMTPLVADVHFNPKVADVAAEEVEKVRINPGNYVDKVKTFSVLEYTNEEYADELKKIKERFVPFLNICKEHHTAIRIGVNHGSLSDRIMSRYGDTPEGMVASCMEFLRICRDEQFEDVVISIKASNTVMMVRTVRMLVNEMEKEGMHYPLHLGVTEAGDGEDGRIKSAVGIGTLLSEGIGDTIRVSLSEDPEVESPVARKLVNYILQKKNHPFIEASLAPGFDPLKAERRKTRPVCNIGGNSLPVVISNRSFGDYEFDFSFIPDYVYIGKENPANLPDNLHLIVDASIWKKQKNVYPLIDLSEVDSWGNCRDSLKFIRLSYEDLTEEAIMRLKQETNCVVILTTHHINGLGEQRAAFHRLITSGCDVPVIIARKYDETNAETIELQSATDIGALLLDGFSDGVMLTDFNCKSKLLDNYMFSILQAARCRVSKTEYISCPSCGRTLYDLQTTVARIKDATSHLKGLKIGVMGCIVNGLGEMADADYGYVGSGRNKINLYKGKECVLRNISEEEAVDSLVNLIKENGDWID